MWEFLNATATGFNSTVWREECQANDACTTGKAVGYFLGLVETTVALRTIMVFVKTVRKAKQRMKQKSGCSQTSSKYSATKNRQKISFAQLQKRFHYKLHVLVTWMVIHTGMLLNLFLGQYGQNIVTNLQAQLYAYCAVVVSVAAHVSHVAAQFNTRKMKKAVRAMRKQQLVNNTQEHDDNVVRVENRKYIFWASSIPILLHVVWVVFAGLNKNLNPINFVRMLQLVAMLPQIIMILVQLFYFTIIFIAMHKNPSYNDDQKRQMEVGKRRLRKRVVALFATLLICAAGLIILMPAFGTMNGWIAANICNTVVTGIVAPSFTIRVLTMDRRIHSSSPLSGRSGFSSLKKGNDPTDKCLAS